ncbi:hypothetical protein [Pseudacidovorax intermedius]|uniref:hypothetical protein n=1 Tax=Pseudacidovorax intermedius TaxID=433924 RepID=UPI00187BD4D6|nr:hypothetical protein [Pseudacidovorax intermedius]
MDAKALNPLLTLTNLLSASNKIGRVLPTVLGLGFRRVERLRAACEMAKAVYDSPHAVLECGRRGPYQGPASHSRGKPDSKGAVAAIGWVGSNAVAFTKQLQADALAEIE